MLSNTPLSFSKKDVKTKLLVIWIMSHLPDVINLLREGGQGWTSR